MFNELLKEKDLHIKGSVWYSMKSGYPDGDVE
jgi:hypothetical protein